MRLPEGLPAWLGGACLGIAVAWGLASDVHATPPGWALATAAVDPSLARYQGVPRPSAAAWTVPAQGCLVPPAPWRELDLGLALPAGSVRLGLDPSVELRPGRPFTGIGTSCEGGSTPATGRSTLRRDGPRLSWGEVEASCAGVAERAPVCAGDRPLQVFAVDGVRRSRGGWAVAGGAVGTLVAGLLVALETWLGRGQRATAASWWAAVPWILAVGPRATAFVDAARLADVDPRWVPAVGAALCVGLLRLLHHAAALSGRPATVGWGVAAAAALVGGVVLVGSLALMRPTGAAFAGLAGASLGAIVAVNSQSGRIRHFNPISLALCLPLIWGAEVALRWWPATAPWAATATLPADGGGWLTADQEDLVALVRGEEVVDPHHRRGAPPVPGAPRQWRLVAMGGSSTGGAFQTDDLAAFYPAALERRLDGRGEVVNQGVGGWTSLHVALWLERKGRELEPDVVTLYVGHNDLTPSRLPYRELWRRAASPHAAWATALAHSRLLLGLRLAVHAAASSAGVAVPPAHLRENLERVATTAETLGARVLVTTEAIFPDGSALDPYAAEMSAVAERHAHVAFVDLRDLAAEPASPSYFLDDCHLTPRGHEALAARLYAHLETLGWLPSAD